jgi:hypothetical protein
VESCGTHLALTKVTSWDSASGPQYSRISSRICDIGLIKISMDVDLHIVYFFQRWNGNKYSGTRRYTSEDAFISKPARSTAAPVVLRIAAFPFCGLHLLHKNTMKSPTVLILTLLLQFLSSEIAATPAVVWTQQSRSSLPSHTSDEVGIGNVLSDVFTDSSNVGVIFLLTRPEDKSNTDGFTYLAPSLSGVAARLDTASVVHHHVTGIDNMAVMERQTIQATSQIVMPVSLDEFVSRVESLEAQEMDVSASGSVTSSKSQFVAQKRAREIAKAQILIVKVETSEKVSERLDSAIVQAIEHPLIGSVLVTAIRSPEEVKLAYEMEHRMRIQKMVTIPNPVEQRRHRRLEDEAAGEGNDNQQYSAEDFQGVVYVSMTPNMLAGLLYFFMFIVVINIAMGCMLNIQGAQDVFVSKLPPIGREA